MSSAISDSFGPHRQELKLELYFCYTQGKDFDALIDITIPKSCGKVTFSSCVCKTLIVLRFGYKCVMSANT